jgi:hypothetical protein
MATSAYIQGRKKYGRPQGLLFANNPGYVDNGIYVPEGREFEDFIILSDDNRGAIDIKNNRIEEKRRMVSGRLRSYHIADKISISLNWDMLPSRSSAAKEIFESTTGESLLPNEVTSYTTDRGAGGVELLEWYRNNQGSFWVYIAYDNYKNMDEDYSKMSQYNEIVEVFFDSFDHSVISRGTFTHDFWNITMTLEEV